MCSCFDEDFSFKEGVNSLFLNQFGISGLPGTRITSNKLNGAILFFCLCIYVADLKGKSFNSSTVKLQKCFVEIFNHHGLQHIMSEFFICG